MTGSAEADGDFLLQAACNELLAGIVSAGWVGKRIGAYRLIEEIGRGGMGTVYLAERDDGQFQKQVAIKLIQPRFVDDSALARFRSERQVLANLQHPFIASLLDGGETDDGAPYMVMEYAKGTPITEYCSSACLSPAERLGLFRKVCEAVSYAHHRSVLHCDLKPANILVTAAGDTKLVDFGIARCAAPEAAPQGTTSATQHATRGYASPEQLAGGPVTQAADIYSLGIVLRELLPNGSAARMRSIIDRSISANPEQRFASVAELSCAIEQFLEEETRRWSPFSRERWKRIVLMAATGLACFGFLSSERAGKETRPELASAATIAHAVPPSADMVERRIPIVVRAERRRPPGISDAHVNTARFREAIPVLQNLANGNRPPVAALASYWESNVLAVDENGTGEFGVIFRRSRKLHALSTEGQLAHFHTSLAFARWVGNWDWAGAEREFHEALRLDPTLLRAWAGYAYLLMKAGRRGEAAVAVRNLQRLSAFSPRSQVLEARLRYEGGDYAGTFTQLNELIGVSPQSLAAGGRFLLALILGHQGKPDQALAELENADLLPDALLANKAWILAQAGHSAEAQKFLNDCRTLGGDCLMGLVGLRKDAELFRALETRVAEHSPMALDLKSDPRFEPLRNHPRFASLLKQMRFP
jgi:tetratricopeptide (TPR) repeat protein